MFKRVVNKVSDTEEKLLKTLNDDEKELLKVFSNAQADLSSISITDGFIDGFCLGMKIPMEVVEK